MAFTYWGTLSSNLDKVRYYLSDTAENAGPLPNDANFSDDELNGLITAEGSWQRAVAAGFEALAVVWARHTTFKADGLSVNRSDTAKAYQTMAREWRRRHGNAGGGAGYRAVTRVDGYGDSTDNQTL